MIEIAPTSNSKNDLTPTAFDHLLRALDSSDRDRAGAQYVELRNHLRQFFVWRGAAFPDEAADETLNRAARKLAEGVPILDLRSFVFGVARFVLLEINRAAERERQARAELPAVQTTDQTREKHTTETRLDCLENCLKKLTEADRALIIDYYQGERQSKIRNRKTLLEKLNLSASGLRMKTLRLREQLERCLQICIEGKAV